MVKKCPVCRKAVKGVSFKCLTCPGVPWVHPRCGGYTKDEILQTPYDQQKNLRCNNCNETDNVDDEGNEDDDGDEERNQEQNQTRHDETVVPEEDFKYEDQDMAGEVEEVTEDVKNSEDIEQRRV